MWSCCIEPDASQAFPIITLAIYANAIVSAAVNADAAIAWAVSCAPPPHGHVTVGRHVSHVIIPRPAPPATSAAR